MKERPKKLIEVALPLDAINKASAREKSIRHGHPSTLHLWWARRPLAAARAVIFAQMVDDPSGHQDLFPTDKAQEKERQRLFRIIEELVKWENTTNERVLQQARDEIWQSWQRTCKENADHPRAKELFDRHKLPAFHDPFAGGGSLPLEAQRLGMEAYASDLNPVAVLINKAMIEIPPKFAGQPPVNPDWQKKTPEEKALRTWKGAQGLAEDVGYYGKWMRDQSEKRTGDLYPKAEITQEMIDDLGNPRPDLKPYIGKKLTVVAWIWARTVKSPNPAFKDVKVPLTSTFMLSTKNGEEAYVDPLIEDEGYRFTVKVGKPRDVEPVKSGTKLGRGANFHCLMSGTPIPREYIYAEANAGRMGARLMAVVAEGEHGRVYLPPSEVMERAARHANPAWKPEIAMPANPRWFSPPLYGIKTYGDLFTPRQIEALTSFSDLVHRARRRVERDALSSVCQDNVEVNPVDKKRVRAYADAIAGLLAFTISRLADRGSSVCSWDLRTGQGRKSGIRNVFSRQAIPMTWDYAEANPFSGIAASVTSALSRISDVLERLPSKAPGFASLEDAGSQTITEGKVVSTDPPYYDNIGYADLSDFFYVWLRRSLKDVFPQLFATLTVPKAEELVATPYRHGTREAAEDFFLRGMTRVMRRLAEQVHPAFPTTIYYAFKQTETTRNGETASTGWETFLDAVIGAGFAVSGTWPVRTELSNRMIGSESNALASSIVLVCRPRPDAASIATLRAFVNQLNSELPDAVAALQRGNIAPVDLAQAAIGPGMAVFTRYEKVIDAQGKPLKVRDALALINQTLDEVLAEQEGDFDADTRWALAWFEQSGFAETDYGLAETLATAKNTSVAGLVEAGILASKAGKVRLLRPDEMSANWDPATDKRLTVWETVHHFIRVLEGEGESAAADLAAKLGSQAEVARELAYRLYTLCERKKRAQEALAYNGLVQSWPEITRLSAESSKARGAHQQPGLF